jgi:hypothetical protein
MSEPKGMASKEEAGGHKTCWKMFFTLLYGKQYPSAWFLLQLKKNFLVLTTDGAHMGKDGFNLLYTMTEKKTINKDIE